MNVLLVFILSCSFVFFAHSEASVHQAKFMKSYWSRKGTVLLKVEGIKTLLKCASLCSPGSTECSGFRHADETCFLYKGIIPGIAYRSVTNHSTDIVYRRRNQCPTNLGYIRITQGSFEFCLRLNMRYLQSSSAEKNCNADGANLVVPKSPEAYEAMAKLWTLYGFRRSSHWIGINAHGHGRTFVSDVDGKKVDNIQWGPSQPDHVGERCAICKREYRFKINDAFCHRYFTSVCEIVL